MKYISGTFSMSKGTAWLMVQNAFVSNIWHFNTNQKGSKKIISSFFLLPTTSIELLLVTFSFVKRLLNRKHMWDLNDKRAQWLLDIWNINVYIFYIIRWTTTYSWNQNEFKEYTKIMWLWKSSYCTKKQNSFCFDYLTLNCSVVWQSLPLLAGTSFNSFWLQFKHSLLRISHLYLIPNSHLISLCLSWLIFEVPSWHGIL